ANPQPDSARLLLNLSARGNQAMYLGLLLLGIGGIGAAWNANQLTTSWVVASYVVLLIVLIAMWAIGAGFYYPLREALTPKDASAAPISADELARRVANRRPEALALVGFGGLLILIWLMTLKPALWG